MIVFIIFLLLVGFWVFKLFSLPSLKDLKANSCNKIIETQFDRKEAFLKMKEALIDVSSDNKFVIELEDFENGLIKSKEAINIWNKGGEGVDENLIITVNFKDNRIKLSVASNGWYCYVTRGAGKIENMKVSKKIQKNYEALPLVVLNNIYVSFIEKSKESNNDW